MILITGGNGQGKHAFAETLLSEKTESRIVSQYHLYLRRRMQEGADEEILLQETKDFCKEHPNAIVVTEEVGCGVVPMDSFERTWREVCGRASVILAERSEQVYRLICGIPQRLK